MKRLAIVFAALALCLSAGAAGGDEVDDLVDVLRPGVKSDVELASKIIEAAKTIGANPELQVKLYKRAYEYGAKSPKGVSVAVEAVLNILETDPPAKADWQQKLLGLYERQYRTARGTERKKLGAAYLNLLIALGDRQLESGSATEALKLYTKAFNLAAYCDPQRKTEVTQKLRQAREKDKLEKRLRQFKTRLKAKPDDHDVRESLIQMYLVEFNEPAEAQKLLTPDVSEQLRTYVPLAAKPVAEIQEGVCLELVNWYRDLAKDAQDKAKLTALCRARDYCQLYLDKHLAGDASLARAKIMLNMIKTEIDAIQKKLNLRLYRDKITFLAKHSMKLYPVGRRYSPFPTQKTNDPLGPFKGRGVYFNQKTGKDVVYEIYSSRPVKEVYWKGAAMSSMTMTALDSKGKVLSSSGPHGGGNHWGEFVLKIPPSASHHFILRIHNKVSTWFFIATLKLR